MKLIIQIILLLTPWKFRSFFLRKYFGFKIDPEAYIGASLIQAKCVHIKKGARIGHLNLIRNLEELHLGEYAKIGTLNWIAGGANLDGHFLVEIDRKPSLVLDDHSAVTHQHIFDCTDQIIIGKYTTIAGYRSQFITHGIDIQTSAQRCGPIEIGEYSMIGTGAIILRSTSIPNCCVVGAGALVSGVFPDSHTLIAGTPGKVVKRLDASSRYFH